MTCPTKYRGLVQYHQKVTKKASHHKAPLRLKSHQKRLWLSIFFREKSKILIILGKPEKYIIQLLFFIKLSKCQLKETVQLMLNLYKRLPNQSLIFAKYIPMFTICQHFYSLGEKKEGGRGE